MKPALLVMVSTVACSGDHGGHDADLLCSTDCTTPPAATCSGTTYTTWAKQGACVQAQCTYQPTMASCAPAQGLYCANDQCRGYDVRCDLCPDHISCNGNLLSTALHHCTASNSPCAWDPATTTDCSTMMTPPPPDCAGTVANTYAASGTCIPGTGGGSAACGYQKTSVDCAATNQICANGACVGP